MWLIASRQFPLKFSVGTICILLSLSINSDLYITKNIRLLPAIHVYRSALSRQVITGQNIFFQHHIISFLHIRTKKTAILTQDEMSFRLFLFNLHTKQSAAFGMHHYYITAY